MYIFFILIEATQDFMRNILSVPPVHNPSHVYENWYARSLLLNEEYQRVFEDPKDTIPNVLPDQFTQEMTFFGSNPFSQGLSVRHPICS